MIKLLEAEEKVKEVKKELRKRNREGFWNLYVIYNLEEENPTLVFRFCETRELKEKEIVIPIEVAGMTYRKWKRIFVPVDPWSVVLPLFLADHYLECYKKNSDGLIKNGNECYISTLIVRNEKGKMGRIDKLCNWAWNMFEEK